MQRIDVSIKAASVRKEGAAPLRRGGLAAGQPDDGLTTALRAEREAIGHQTQTLLQRTLRRDAAEGRGGNPRSQRTDAQGASLVWFLLVSLPPRPPAHMLLSHTLKKKYSV